MDVGLSQAWVQQHPLPPAISDDLAGDGLERRHHQLVSQIALLAQLGEVIVHVHRLQDLQRM